MMRERGLVKRLLVRLAGEEEAESMLRDLEEIRDHRRRTGGVVRAELRHRLELLLYPWRLVVEVVMRKRGRVAGGVVRGVGEDAGYALRSLGRSRGFAGVTVLILALCLGATAAVFSLVRAVLLDAMPYEDPDALVAVWMVEESSGTRMRMTPGNYTDLVARMQVLASAGAFTGSRTTITTGGGEPEIILGGAVTPSYFEVLGVRPLHGRTFEEDEAVSGAAPVVVLGHDLWRRRFGSDASVVGQLVNLDGTGFEVVGVMPPGLYPVSATIATDIPFLKDAQEYFVPLMYTAELWANRRPHIIGMIGRLPAGATFERARSAMAAVGGGLAMADVQNADETLTISRLTDEIVGDVRTALLVLMGSIGLVLLIATANVAGLLIVRTDARTREFAVRAAVGAGRWRLVRQTLLECGMLGLAGAAAAVPVAWAVLAVIRTFVPFDVPRLADASIDPVVLAVTLAAGMAAALAFGVAPALHASRARSTEVLGRSSAGLTSDSKRRLLHQWLVGLQAALVVVVTVGAALLLRSVRELNRVDPGFANGEALVVPLNAALDVLVEIRDRAAQVPGIASVAIAYDHPLERTWIDGFRMPGRPVSGEDGVGNASVRPVDHGYLETVGIGMIDGRGFTDADRSGARPVAIVNRALAERYFPDGRVIGEFIDLPSGPRIYGDLVPERWEIVGIARDERFLGPQAALEPALYLPLAQFPAGGKLLVLPAGQTRDLGVVTALRGIVRDIDPTLAFPAVRSMSDILGDELARPRFNTLLLASFATLGLLLCSLGVYALAGRAVAARMQELGIRSALGARPLGLTVTVLGGTVFPVVLGAAIGSASVVALANVMRSLLFGVSPRDPATLAITPILIIGIAMLGAIGPALRALATSPARVLRPD